MPHHGSRLGRYEALRLLPQGAPVTAIIGRALGRPTRLEGIRYIRPGARGGHLVARANKADAAGWWVEAPDIELDRERLKTCDPRIRKNVTLFFENSETKMGENLK